MTDEQGWYGFDLDGTLAEYSTWQGIEHIGNPIAPIVHLVMGLLSKGKRVKIFTARAGSGEDAINIIKTWCILHLGRSLEVTNVKDFAMIHLYDDRCSHVVRNMGIVIETLYPHD